MNRLAQVLVWSILLGAGSARAQEPFRQTASLSAETLSKVRAGFVDLNGVQFSFAVLTQTFINGQLVLATQLTVDGPAHVTRSVTGQAQTISTDPDGGVVTMTSHDGLTTVLQSMNALQVANVVTTSASNQTIRQATSVSVLLQGFEQNQASYALQHVVSNLNLIFGIAAVPVR